MSYRRYTEIELQRQQFYMMPKWLMTRQISSDAKLLYVYILDRYRLSLKNGWVDENGEAYCYFKRTEMSECLGISENTTKAKVDELMKEGLLEEVRQGLGKPNRLYLCTPTDDEFSRGNTEDSENTEETAENARPLKYEFPEYELRNGRLVTVPRTQDSRPEKTAVQKPRELPPNKNNKNKNYINNNKRERGVPATRLSTSDLNRIMNHWNFIAGSVGVPKIIGIDKKTERYRSLCARVDAFGVESVLKVFDDVGKQEFLHGKNQKGWTATFDWVLKPANFQKIMEGNYRDKKAKAPDVPYCAVGASHGYTAAEMASIIARKIQESRGDRP